MSNLYSPNFVFACVKQIFVYLITERAGPQYISDENR